MCIQIHTDIGNVYKKILLISTKRHIGMDRKNV